MEAVFLGTFVPSVEHKQAHRTATARQGVFDAAGNGFIRVGRPLNRARTTKRRSLSPVTTESRVSADEARGRATNRTAGAAPLMLQASALVAAPHASARFHALPASVPADVRDQDSRRNEARRLVAAWIERRGGTACLSCQGGEGGSTIQAPLPASTDPRPWIAAWKRRRSRSSASGERAHPDSSPTPAEKPRGEGSFVRLGWPSPAPRSAPAMSLGRHTARFVRAMRPVAAPAPRFEGRVGRAALAVDVPPQCDVAVEPAGQGSPAECVEQALPPPSQEDVDFDPVAVRLPSAPAEQAVRKAAASHVAAAVFGIMPAPMRTPGAPASTLRRGCRPFVPGYRVFHAGKAVGPRSAESPTSGGPVHANAVRYHVPEDCRAAFRAAWEERHALLRAQDGFVDLAIQGLEGGSVVRVTTRWASRGAFVSWIASPAVNRVSMPEGVTQYAPEKGSKSLPDQYVPFVTLA